MLTAGILFGIVPLTTGAVRTAGKDLKVLDMAFRSLSFHWENMFSTQETNINISSM